MGNFYLETSRISVNIAWLALIVGVVLGLISITLGIIPFLKPYKTSPALQEQKNKIELINKEQSAITPKIEDLTYL
jgi:K+-transporting ATPase A subunit